MSSYRCNVQQKIPCLFKTVINDHEKSHKWSKDSHLISASDLLEDEAAECLSESTPTEKVDGTSCFVNGIANGQPWLWVRRDRRPTKNAEKRFRKWQQQQNKTRNCGKTAEEDIFHWDVKTDFKDSVADWIPMLNIKLDADGLPIPSVNGHIPGWIPVDGSSRSHCWHLSALNLEQMLIALLRPGIKSELELSVVSLDSLVDRTIELIGSHINGNPYGLGSKNQPFHVFVEHGSIPISSAISTRLSDIHNWFESDDGQVEGIVWHTAVGKLFKLHRHHLHLPWPVENPRISRLRTRINIGAITEHELECSEDRNVIGQMLRWSERNGPILPLADLARELMSEERSGR